MQLCRVRCCKCRCVIGVATADHRAAQRKYGGLSGKCHNHDYNHDHELSRFPYTAPLRASRRSVPGFGIWSRLNKPKLAASRM